MQRRNFLKLASGGLVFAAAGATAFAVTRTPTAARAPWSAVGQYDDPRLRALSHAILAPNPHNRQPWIVDLEGNDALTLYFDTDKQLPHTDPFDRQLTIGLGCFLELMVMAAAAEGITVELDLFPEGEDADGLDTRPVARARFQAGSVEADPLFAAFPHRRTTKEPFDTTRPVAADVASRIAAAARFSQAGGSVDPDDIAYWREQTSEALRIEIETPHTYKESVDLFRIGKAEVNANPDGIDFTGALFDGLHLAGVMTRETLLDTNSIGYQQGIAALMANTNSAMGHLWLVTAGNSRVDQIKTGADWLRINLACAAEGVAFQPLSQALQEYPEMAALYDQTHKRLVPDGGTVQMLARIGYADTVPVSPRWPIEAKIRPA